MKIWQTNWTFFSWIYPNGIIFHQPRFPWNSRGTWFLGVHGFVAASGKLFQLVSSSIHSSNEWLLSVFFFAILHDRNSSMPRGCAGDASAKPIGWRWTFGSGGAHLGRTHLHLKVLWNAGCAYPKSFFQEQHSLLRRAKWNWWWSWEGLGSLSTAVEVLTKQMTMIT